MDRQRDTTAEITPEAPAAVATPQLGGLMPSGPVSMASLARQGADGRASTMRALMRLQAGQDWKKNQKLSAECERLQKELDGSGRLLIRASGTEPVLRVMVEASDERVARSAAETLAEAVRAG